MPKDEVKRPFEIWCDLLEAELQRGLQDLAEIREADTQEGKRKCRMLRAALVNAQYYLGVIQDLLK